MKRKKHRQKTEKNIKNYGKYFILTSWDFIKLQKAKYFIYGQAITKAAFVFCQDQEKHVENVYNECP